jgi:chaperone modulatory protein CbpM
MKVEVTEVRWVDQHGACSLRELAEVSRLSEDELRELVALGVLRPVAASEAAAPGGGAADEGLRFAAECRATMRVVRRLRDDFELDPHGLSVALALLERIDDLERQLRALRAQLPDSPR